MKNARSVSAKRSIGTTAIWTIKPGVEALSHPVEASHGRLNRLAKWLSMSGMLVTIAFGLP
jgi:hypothetical protein